MIGCNHIRSYQYFIETVNSPEKFLAAECQSWEHYQNGSCFQCDYNPKNINATKCVRLGFHSINSFLSRYAQLFEDWLLLCVKNSYNKSPTTSDSFINILYQFSLKLQ